MDVFLAGIIQGSLVEARIHDQQWRDVIRRILGEHLAQADVYCHYSCHPESIQYEMSDIRRTLADGNARAAACDLLIAYVPTASMGTAIEMYEAHRHGAAVVTVSPLAANWVIRACSHRIVPDLEAFEALAAGGELGKLVEEHLR